MKFEQFTPKMLDFLMENHLNNSKAWFDAHRAEYRALVVEPFYALTEALAPVLLEIDPQLVVTPPRVLSRVRRDTRFTRNKDLYRDHAWLTFRRPRQPLGSSLCYYFEIEQEGWGYGVGFYDIPSDVRGEYRAMILHRDKTYLAARAALEKFPCFQLFGERYRRVLFPDAPEADQDWLNRKNAGAGFFCGDFTPLFDGSFFDALPARLLGAAPFYHFLRTAESRVRRS